MTASEKLRALDAKINSGVSIIAYADELDVLKGALPLIADCIEAAELCAPLLWPYTDKGALLPLQASLDALAEHLEGGDVT